MDHVKNFVSYSNIGNYLDRLRTDELQPSIRTTLLGLLIEEEDRLGRTQEQLERAEQLVDDGRKRIEKLIRIMDGTDLDEAGQRRSATLLINMQAIQQLLEAHRERLRLALESNQL